LREVGADPKKKKKDGKKAGYRLSVLVNMTVADYDADVLIDLCVLYAMDVLFLRDLGHPTHCDGLV